MKRGDTTTTPADGRHGCGNGAKAPAVVATTATRQGRLRILVRTLLLIVIVQNRQQAHTKQEKAGEGSTVVVNIPEMKKARIYDQRSCCCCPDVDPLQ